MKTEKNLLVELFTFSITHACLPCTYFNNGNTNTEASLVAQRLKCLPPMRETQVCSLGREDPLEKEMVTHSSILAWKIPWMEKPGRIQSMGSQSPTQLSNFTFTFKH